MAGWIKTLSAEPGMTSVLDLPHLNVRLLRLAQGERTTTRTGRTHETAAVFASGRVSATADGRFWANCGAPVAAAPWTQFWPTGRGRSDAGASARPRRRITPEFRPLAHTTPWPLHQAMWLPPDASLELQAIEPAEVLLFAVDLGGLTGQAAGRLPELHGPREDASREVGTGAARRLVTPLLTPGKESVILALGETYNPPGGWSTYPPHRHDRRARDAALDGAEETQHEEVYIARFAPTSGFGLARVYEQRDAGAAAATGAAYLDPAVSGYADQALTFKHAEALAIMQGYHTVVSAPGYHLHYLWALAGPRAGVPQHRADPLHAWVEQEL